MMLKPPNQWGKEVNSSRPLTLVRSFFVGRGLYLRVHDWKIWPSFFVYVGLWQCLSLHVPRCVLPSGFISTCNSFQTTKLSIEPKP